MHCTLMLLAHIWLIYPLGHVYAELKLEEPTDQVQAEDPANSSFESSQPPVHLRNDLCLYLNLCFMFHYDCALTLQELYGAIVPLRPTFLITPVNPVLWWLTVSNAMLR
jgi:hypothetical protein